ncbi:hypothetical protein T01_12546 [Trichinella spiralis]|uniref:Uncharacterized protein n=1 Tax=Trichinella spiralis TaxID=6334 RepID=A0A0V1BQX6_TRISP|nr:hypothetical protein T01_12546 [Trichinella spiralis]
MKSVNEERITVKGSHRNLPISRISAEPEHRTMQMRYINNCKLNDKKCLLQYMRYHHRCFKTMAISKYLSHIFISNKG